MGSMNRGQVFELAFWTLFAVGAFAISFDFDRDIEIYKFGASGWPRAVIVFIVLAVLGQLYHDLRERKRQDPQPSSEETQGADVARGAAYYVRVGAVLLVPLIYAACLERLGFYFLTPVFIIAFLLIGGERRWGWIIGVTAFLYIFYLLLFAKLLYVGLPTGNVHPFYDFSNWLLVKIR